MYSCAVSIVYVSNVSKSVDSVLVNLCKIYANLPTNSKSIPVNVAVSSGSAENLLAAFPSLDVSEPCFSASITNAVF